LYLTTGASPYESLMVADVGDIYMTMYNLPQACEDIRDAFRKLIGTGCKTLAMGGDHTVTYPILQAYGVSFGILFEGFEVLLVII
jgi:arginase family enzyme